MAAVVCVLGGLLLALAVSAGLPVSTLAVLTVWAALTCVLAVCVQLTKEL